MLQVMDSLPSKPEGSPQVALVVKNPPANVGHLRGAGSIAGWGRSAGEENSNLLQYSCLENPMERGACQAPVCGVAKSRTQLKRLSTLTCILSKFSCNQYCL